MAAAGNQGEEVSDFGPAGSERVVTVAMLGVDGKRSRISNYGKAVDIIAPGEDIYSLIAKDAEWQGPAFEKNRRYYKSTGTSFAAPFVSGVASLLWARQPELSNAEVEAVILETAEDLGDSGRDIYTGAGLLRADRALGG